MPNIIISITNKIFEELFRVVKLRNFKGNKVDYPSANVPGIVPGFPLLVDGNCDIANPGVVVVGI